MIPPLAHKNSSTHGLTIRQRRLVAPTLMLERRMANQVIVVNACDGHERRRRTLGRAG
jgi:hypothetical protein